MSRDLTDVLHAFVDDQARASAAQGPDLAQRARTVAALARRRRTQRVGGLAAASVALLAVGAVAASALTGPEPQPAVPEPSATASASPSPSATTTPAPSPPPPAGLVTPGIPDRTAPWVRGWVDSLELSPTPLWTVSAVDIVVDWTEDFPPAFGHISRGAVRPGAQVVDAGETLVAMVADIDLFRRELVGLDAATGAVRWAKGEEHPRPTFWCAGVSPDALVVCVGSSGTASPMELQLLEPASGEVVRAYPLDHGADAFGLVGSIAVLHGSASSDGTDVVWTGVDVRTGEVVWSHVAPDRGEPYEITGDPVTATVGSWPFVRLEGYFYTVVIDVRTGEEIASPVDPMSSGYLDVWAPNDPEEVPVLDPWARDESGAPVLGIRDRLRALDPDDGTVLWETEAPDLMSRAVVGDVLVASDDESTTLGLDVMTGRVLWTAPVTGEGVATDGELLLLSSGVVLRLADGAVVRDGDGTGWPPLGRSGRLAAVGETLTLYGW